MGNQQPTQRKRSPNSITIHSQVALVSVNARYPQLTSCRCSAGHSASLSEDGRSLEPQLPPLAPLAPLAPSTPNVNAMYGAGGVLSPAGARALGQAQHTNGHNMSNMLLVGPPLAKASSLNAGGSTNPRKYGCKMCPQVSVSPFRCMCTNSPR